MVALGLLASCGLSSPAWAQLEEVVVTAQKREQSLQDVAISATAFNEDTIEAMSMKDIGDALAFAPNIKRSYGPSAAQDGFFFFRGVGQQDVLVVVDPGVAVYIDDIYLGRLQGASFDVLDIERIELLRGPQGTLFGRNTVGGAVSVHTRDPKDEFEISGRLTAGERNRLDAYGVIDLPMTDTLKGSLSAYSKEQDGWVTNADGTTLGDIDNTGGRIKLQWDALDNLSFRLSADYSDSDGTPTPQMLTAVNPSRVDGPLAIPLPTDMAADIIADPFNSRANISVDPSLTSTRSGVSLTTDWDAGLVNVKSITAWREMEQDAYTDLDGGPYSVYDSLFSYDQSQISQEFQFSGNSFDDRLTWLVGAYYFTENVGGFTGLCVGTGHVGPLVPLPPPFDPGVWLNGAPPVRGDGRCFGLASDIDLDVDAWAGFGNFEFAFTDTLTGIFGIRYTDETKTQTYNTATDNRDGVYTRLYSIPPAVQEHGFAWPGEFLYDVSANNPNLTIPYRYKKSWHDLSPKLGLNYKLSDLTMLYASWSNGFKSGGFGGRNTPGDPFLPYDPETIETWEAGIKTELFDRRMRVNAATFWSKYDDVQLLVIGAVQGTDNLFITTNGGDAEIKGMELEIQALPTDNLNLSLGVGYLDTKWKTLKPGTVIPLDGDLPQTPEWTVSAAARYTFQLGKLGELTVGGDYTYSSDYFFDPENLAEQQSYDVVNLRATYKPADSGFTFSIYGLNVLNEEFYYAMDNNLADLGTTTVIPAPASEWGVEATFAFK